MYRRVVMIVAIALFALLAVVATIITDLRDRALPVSLDAKAAVSIDFDMETITDQEALIALSQINEDLNMKMYKVVPDGAGQAFYALGATSPTEVTRFGTQPNSKVSTNESLENSLVNGSYIITTNDPNQAAFIAAVSEIGGTVQWTSRSSSTTLSLLIHERSFTSAVAAAIALTTSMVLFWLAIRARGRELRVLAGISAFQVQLEDLGELFAILLVSATTSDAVAIVAVGFTQGWAFVPYYVSVLGLLAGIILGICALLALSMSVATWPTGESIATRQPSGVGLRNIASVLTVSVLAMAIGGATPAFTAYQEADQAEKQQSIWYRLDNAVRLTFPAGLGEDGFVSIMPSVANIVSSADTRESAALSFTWTSDLLTDSSEQIDSPIAIVNQEWISLMTLEDTTLQRIEPADVPQEVLDWIEPQLAIWSREPDSALHLQYFRVSEGGIQMAQAGSGDLILVEDGILVVIPEIGTSLNDDFLASATSSQNIIFVGLNEMKRLVKQSDLDSKVTVQRIADEGILRAQYAAFFLWLRSVSLFGLVIALTLAATVNALIVARLKARSDFPRRLSGDPWIVVVSSRLGLDLIVGVVVAAAVLVWQLGQPMAPGIAMATFALIIAPFIHILATRWAFRNLAQRGQ